MKMVEFMVQPRTPTVDRLTPVNIATPLKFILTRTATAF